MYIAIEGIDTAGKSTQIEALSQHFSDAIITKEPGATKIGKEIREVYSLQERRAKKQSFYSFLQIEQNI